MQGEPYSLSPTTLCAFSLQTPGGMTKTLNRLETDGLVRRRTDRDDRRALLVELSAKGLRSVGTLLEQTLRGYADAFQALDSSHLKDRIRALRATLTTLERATGTEPTDVWVNIDRDGNAAGLIGQRLGGDDSKCRLHRHEMSDEYIPLVCRRLIGKTILTEIGSGGMPTTRQIACGAAAIAALGLLSGQHLYTRTAKAGVSDATPNTVEAKDKRGFVVTYFETARSFTLGKQNEECPDGYTPGLQEAVFAALPPGRLKDHLAGSRPDRISYAIRSTDPKMCQQPTAYQMPPVKEVQSKTAYGANLDGGGDRGRSGNGNQLRPPQIPHAGGRAGRQPVLSRLRLRPCLQFERSLQPAAGGYPRFQPKGRRDDDPG